jgi:hypothetical protein
MFKQIQQLECYLVSVLKTYMENRVDGMAANVAAGM